jgi:hypothetical protein
VFEFEQQQGANNGNCDGNEHNQILHKHEEY